MRESAEAEGTRSGRPEERQREWGGGEPQGGRFLVHLSLGRQRDPPQYRRAIGVQHCWLCAQSGGRGLPHGLWIDVREEKSEAAHVVQVQTPRQMIDPDPSDCWS